MADGSYPRRFEMPADRTSLGRSGRTNGSFGANVGGWDVLYQCLINDQDQVS